MKNEIKEKKITKAIKRAILGYKNNLNTSKDSKLQSQDDLNSQSPGGMEISLSPVGMAKTPSDYRSRSIRYV